VSYAHSVVLSRYRNVIGYVIRTQGIQIYSQTSRIVMLGQLAGYLTGRA
jgi:hypothetical protein